MKSTEIISLWGHSIWGWLRGSFQDDHDSGPPCQLLDETIRSLAFHKSKSVYWWIAVWFLHWFLVFFKMFLIYNYNYLLFISLNHLLFTVPNSPGGVAYQRTSPPPDWVKYFIVKMHFYYLKQLCSKQVNVFFSYRYPKDVSCVNHHQKFIGLHTRMVLLIPFTRHRSNRTVFHLLLSWVLCSSCF